MEPIFYKHASSPVGTHSPATQGTRLLIFLAIRKHGFGNFKINIWLGGKWRKVFILFIIMNPVQNTLMINQRLDPNFKMFSLFHAYLSDNKMVHLWKLITTIHDKIINSFFFFFATILKWFFFSGRVQHPLCVGRWGLSSVSSVHYNENLETINGRLSPPLQKSYN